MTPDIPTPQNKNKGDMTCARFEFEQILFDQKGSKWWKACRIMRRSTRLVGGGGGGGVTGQGAKTTTTTIVTINHQWSSSPSSIIIIIDHDYQYDYQSWRSIMTINRLQSSPSSSSPSPTINYQSSASILTYHQSRPIVITHRSRRSSQESTRDAKRNHRIQK